MQARIEQSIRNFREVVDDSRIDLPLEAAKALNAGIGLLDSLSKDLNDPKLKDKKIQDDHDAIVFGAVIRALSIYANPNEVGLVNNISAKKFFDRYNNILASITPSEKLRADYDEVSAVGYRILREMALPYDCVKKESPLGQIITKSIPADRIALHEERYQERQLYLKVYQSQERHHRLRLYAERALAILAAIIPPLSLIFTIRHVLGKDKSSPSWWRVIFSAIIPIFSTTESFRAINYIDRNNHSKDPIQKITLTKKLWKVEKQERKQFKEGTWGIINIQLEQGRKPEKVVISYEKNGTKMVDIYTINRDSRSIKKIKEFASKQDQTQSQEKKREDAVSKFFKPSYEESRKVVDELKVKYSVRC